MATVKFISVPSKRLASSINASSTSFQLNNIKGWDGVNLTASDFGTKLYAVFRNDTNNLMELAEIDPATIASGSIDFIRRGLKFTGDLTTEVAANKLTWIKNETIVELGSNPPQLLEHIVRTIGDQTIAGKKTFSEVPAFSEDATDSNDGVRYSQLLAATFGTVNASPVVIPGNAGETVAIDQLVYFDVSDSEWYLADADTAAEVDNIILGITKGAGTNGNAITGGITLFGLHTFAGATLTANSTYYASNTAGGFSDTPGTTEVVVGASRNTSSLYFYPRYNQQLTENQQDALAGTSGTPSSSNKFVTNDDTATVATASKVVRALGTGLIDQTFIPTQEVLTFTAGAALTAGQALHLTPYSQNGTPITFDAYSATNYNNVTNQSKTFSVGNNSNRLLLVKVVASATPTSVTYNSVAMSLVTSRAMDGTYTMYLYKLVAPSTGSNSILVTSTGIYQISASSYYNVDQATNVEAFASSATGTSITVAITTLSQGALVYGTYSTVGGSNSGTPGVGQVTSDSKYDNSYTGSNVNYFFDTTGAIRADVTGDTNVLNEAQARNITSSYGFTSTGATNAGLIVVSIKPATTVSMAVLPTNSSAISQNEPLIDFIGFAGSSVSVGASVSVVTGGVVTGLSGLTAGATYYLQDTNGTIGTSRGTYGKIIGRALSTTTLLIKPEKTMGQSIQKVTAYTYTAECDGFASATAVGATATIATESVSTSITGTATNGGQISVPVSRGKTYTITSATSGQIYFTPLA